MDFMGIARVRLHAVNRNSVTTTGLAIYPRRACVYWL